MRLRRRPAFALAGLLTVAAAGAAALGSPPAREWLRQATGEESLVEGLKGIGALALIEASGPRLELAPDMPVGNLDVNPYGVNVFLQLEADPENVRRTFATLRDAGLGWARQEVPWEDLEIHARGDFEDRRNDPPRSAWDKYDRIVRLARDHGVRLLLRLDNPPDWAFADPAAAGEKGPPDDPEDYGHFVAGVAGRYCDSGAAYQIWNEPNIYPEWGERDVDPTGYAALLAVGALRVREACPGAVIVSAALAQTTEPGGRNMDDLAYLEALYDAGWQGDFDVLAVQAFGLWTGPTDRRVSRDRTNFVRPLLARDIMVRHGDADKAVWITEMGWDSPPPEMDAPYGRVTEEQRAEYTAAAFRRMHDEWPWIGVGFVWFLRRPDAEWQARPEGWFRLLEPDWTETASFRALADLARGPQLLGRGRHGPASPGIAFSGPWREAPGVGGRRPRLGTPGAEVAFSFSGTGFRLALAPPGGDEPTQVFLVVDGETETVAPVTTEEGGLVFARRGLAAARHDVIARVDAGELALAEVRVEAPDPPSVWVPVQRGALVLGSIAVLVVGLAMARRRRQPPTAPVA